MVKGFRDDKDQEEGLMPERRQQTMSRTTLLLTAGLLAIGAAALLTPLQRITNCGGNSAALSQVHGIALIAYLGTFDAPDHTFRFTAANPEQSPCSIMPSSLI